MIMSAYHAIKKLGHNIVLKEIQHLTGMTHCASFSGMEQFGSGSRGTEQLFHACSGNNVVRLLLGKSLTFEFGVMAGTGVGPPVMFV
jgi:hypothetical protein